MPRIGQLLSALLIALIGVLVVQMFLFAALQRRTVEPPTPSPGGTDRLAIASQPLNVPRAAAPAPEQRLVVIIITQGHPPPRPAPAGVLEFPVEVTGELAVRPNEGEEVIERFIALSGKLIGSGSVRKEE